LSEVPARATAHRRNPLAVAHRRGGAVSLTPSVLIA